MKNTNREKILLVKLGALGDLIMAFQEIAYLRQQHRDAEITLLTRYLYTDFMAHCPWIDAILKDNNPHSFNPFGMIAMNRKIAAGKFSMICRLQNSSRVKRYLFGVRTPNLPKFQAPKEFTPDKSWLLKADVSRFLLPSSYVVVIPGSAPHRTEKHWSADNYGKLCLEITKRSTSPVIIGGKSELEIATQILAHCPTAINLTNKTSLIEIMPILSKAKLVIGNDTGATHMSNYIGSPTLMLFSDTSKKIYQQQHAKHVSKILSPQLSDLSVAEVASYLP